MCGIIGYIGFRDPKDILLEGLKRLEYRGYDSAGIAVLEDDDVEVFRCEGRIQRLEERLATHAFHGTMGIGHTRWATHGAPTELNAHPHRVGAITLVHNGIIENYMEHKEALRAQGRTFSSDTDSEIVAHLFDVEIQKGKGLLAAVQTVLPHLKGAYAFVVMSDREPDLLIGVRNGAPLLLGVSKDENFVASDVQAILHRTNRIVYLKDHQFAVCRRNSVELHELDGTPVPLVVKEINWSPDQMEKAGYRHYMLKEIHEQAQALSQTIDTHIDHASGIISLNELALFRDPQRKIKRISIVACGTARHAGLIGKYYFERFARVPVDVDFGSEFRYRDPILDEETLLVAISQSGETADTLAALREGKGRGIPTLAVCNVRESTLAREADYVFYTSAGPEIGVASTKAFTTQLAALYMLAVETGYRNGHLNYESCAELTHDLLKLPVLVDQVLQSEKEIEALAKAHADQNFFFYMGRDLLYPIALEGALKLKEISYAHAEGYPAGELKHGPIALIDPKATIIVLAPKDQPSRHLPPQVNTASLILLEKVMSNLQEVKSRGGRIVTFTSEGGDAFARESQSCVKLPSAPWALNPILMTIPMQLFSYYFALLKGTDVDKPRNLAKSVTVE